MAGTVALPNPLRQTKKDVNFDIETELGDTRNYEWIRDEVKARLGKGFLPYIAKLDKKAYYNQFANRFPHLCCYAMWDSNKNRFRFFESHVLDFGSIHAIWWPIRVA